MGEIPEWYDLFRAAKAVGVSAPELIKLPVYWRNLGSAAASLDRIFENGG